MDAMIQVRDLRKTYKMGEIDVPALRGVSFSIQRGEFVAIMGPSGSGKSTLMNLLGCLDTPTAGQYILDGLPVEQLDRNLLAAVRNRKIGFVFQQFNLLPRQNAQENVALPLVYLGGVPTAERLERAKQVLEQVGLGDRLLHRPKELSGGQQQRVAIARALITRPALLLADEPTGNLDSHASVEIMALFKELNQSGITIVVVTHEPDIAKSAARVLTVRDGVLASDTATRPQPLNGSPTNIWQRPQNGQTAPTAPSQRRRFSIARRPPLAAKRRNMSTLTPTVAEDPQAISGTVQTAADSSETVDVLDEQMAALQTGGISLMETLEIALKSLTANKLRTLLTALGIIIGVAAVVALMAIGNGSQATITANITANGANLLTVRSGAPNTGGVRGAIGGGQTLTTKDAEALADPQNVPDAMLISPEFNGNGQLVAGSYNTNASIIGAKPAYMAVHNITLAEGDFISDDNVTGMANLAVLGANVAGTLFPGGDALGQSIRINGQSFKVAGVLAAKGGSGFGSTDDGVIVPLSTAQRKLFGGRAIRGGAALLSSIAVQAKDSDSVTTALDEVTQVLRTQHDLPPSGAEDDFSVINQQDILNSVASTTQTLTLFLGAIAAISLIVGGIGIMNIMLVSVRERTREIGLRKALGAREGDILTQFMIEALTISLVGALIGLTLGVLIAVAVNVTGLMAAAPSFSAAALAVGFAMAIGLFFGIAPARSAARLDPIDALRYD